MRMPDGRWDPFDDYVIDFALERVRAGRRVAIVTLAAIEGSSPRPLGAQMAVTEAGEWVGYLSGGCVERAVVAEAVEAIRAGENRRVRYGRGSRYMDIRLPCGSAIELDIDVTLGERALEAIDRRVRHRHTAFLETGGAPSLAYEAGEPRAYLPRLRLVVLGVGPAAVCLARLARISGLDTLLGSPDAATRAAVEGVETLALSTVAPEGGIPADTRTAIAFMFHDHEWERLLLPAALRSPAFYIGALGSHRSHAARLQMLCEAGADEGQVARVRGPAGLFHGARSAQAIAVSILAEIMEADIRRAVPAAPAMTRAAPRTAGQLAGAASG